MLLLLPAQNITGSPMIIIRKCRQEEEGLISKITDERKYHAHSWKRGCQLPGTQGCPPNFWSTILHKTYRTPEFKYISLTVILRMMGRESQGKAVLRNPVQGLNSETRKL